MTAQTRGMLDLGPLDRRYLLPFDTGELSERTCDVLVVGSGIAGLVAALHAAAFARVLLVTKARLSQTNTWYAQGGIAGAVGEADSVELHVADTLVVGQGLCEPDVVRAVVGEAPAALADLESFGVAFDRAPDGSIALAREGGHSLPRVLHSGDATGAQIQDALTRAVRTHAGIEIAEEAFLADLLTDEDGCLGALVLERDARRPTVVWAGATVLATGGCGQAFRVTTNPAIATGDGVAAAWRAGAVVADMEFVQFHPTALDSASNPKFLITEALRGEGAYLLDCEERRFMLDAHPLAELAPRDVVSREIERVMARCGRPNVWLDARHLGEAFLKARFPTIWRACRDAGFDLARDLIPVAPAAHYAIGGVLTDRDGRTTLARLYASGEAAASGLHGANRLASNSLLEGLVFSRRIARALEREQPRARRARIVAGVDGDAACGTALVRGRVQALMSEHVGMTRCEEGLEGACAGIEGLAAVLRGPAADVAAIEPRNLVTVAALIACAARAREESRGVHFRSDFPDRDDARWRVRLAWRRGEEAPAAIPVVGGESEVAAP
ncbi:MAG: L-aspartate oxidase [Coriobacteriia bacterium]|nr:L-aspartate oxidase [Coriobacteriia bacterium]